MVAINDAPEVGETLMLPSAVLECCFKQPTGELRGLDDTMDTNVLL